MQRTRFIVILADTGAIIYLMVSIFHPTRRMYYPVDRSEC